MISLSKRFLVHCLIILVLVVLVPAVAVGGGKEEKPTEPAETTEAAKEDMRGGELIRGVSRVHRRWDYNTEPVWFAPQTMQRIYSNLIRFDPKDGTTIVADLATLWENSTYAKTFTFTLRDCFKWHA